MLDFSGTSAIRLATILLVATPLLASGQAARAADGNEEGTGLETRPRRVNVAQWETQKPETPKPVTASFKVAYVLYDQSLTAKTSSERSIATDARFSGVPADEPLAIAPLPGAPPQTSPTVASTAPMTAGEKFSYWIHHSFLAPDAYGGAIVSGLVNELRDNDDFKEDTVGNYFADSMTRAARSFAFGATARFFEKGVFPSILRQDIRYHRSGKKGAGARVVYAATRVFVTQGDRCACHQVNASFLLGAAATTGMSNLWERRERTGPGHNLRRFYTHVYLTALFNVVREFVSGQ